MPAKFESKKVNKKSATIGSIFINRSKLKGKKYFKISVNADALNEAIVDGQGYITLLAFENGYKETENHPDLVVYLGEPQQARTAAPKRNVNQTTRRAPVASEESETEDDVSPF